MRILIASMSLDGLRRRGSEAPARMKTDPRQSLQRFSPLLLDAYVSKVSAVTSLAQREIIECGHGASQSCPSAKEVCLAATRAAGRFL